MKPDHTVFFSVMLLAIHTISIIFHLSRMILCVCNCNVQINICIYICIYIYQNFKSLSILAVIWRTIKKCHVNPSFFCVTINGIKLKKNIV